MSVNKQLSPEEIRACAAGLRDGMGGHADYCAELMERAALMIARLHDDYTAQCLALKAAKAMQQAETERADANELDKRRIDYLSDYGGEWDAWTLWTHGNGFEGDGTLRGAIDEAILHS